MRDNKKLYLKKAGYGLLGIAVMLGVVTLTAQAETSRTRKDYESMELIQGGAYAVPKNNYSFREPEVETMITYQDGGEETDEKTLAEKQEAAQNARANNNATLAERMDACAKTLYNGMTALEYQINVGEFALTSDEFRTVISDVVNSNPELFYIRNGYRTEKFDLSKEDSTQIVDFCYGFYENQDSEFHPDRDKIIRRRELLNDKKSEILNSIIVRGMSPLEKALVIHDYIVSSTKYDYSAYLNYNTSADKDQSKYFEDEDFDVYGTLIGGKAVCQGYSLSFKYLLEAAGVSNIGFASNSSHIWNTITLDGAGYYVDCTWDDPNWDTLGDVKHVYFMKSEQALTNHTITQKDRVCNGTAYDDAFWNEVNCAILYYKGNYYYIAADGNLYSTKLGDSSDIRGIKNKVADLALKKTDSWNYSNAAKMVMVTSNVLYHDSQGIYYYNVKNGERGTVCRPSLEENELIYGLSYLNGEFSYSTRMQKVDGDTVAYQNVEQKITQYTLPQSIFSVPVESVTVTGNSQLLLTMENGNLVGEKTQLTANVLPEYATDKRILQWISSDSNVAVVDINGTVKAVGPGTATITAIAYDGEIRGSITISVLHDGVITRDGKTVYYANGVKLTNQFFNENGKTYYLGEDGTKLTGWQVINGSKYYLNDQGEMLTGWQKLSDRQYYFSEKGVMLTNWQTIGGKQYYFSNDGVMLTDWQNISNKKYYFTSSGVMLTGWQKLSGKQYYFDKNGALAVGWQKLNGKKYYFDSTGIMQTGFKTIKKKKYYFNSKGVMQTGFKTIKKKKYYFNSKGVMQTGFCTIKKKTYYFNGKGIMQTGWKTIKKKKYYFNSKGVMQTGLVKIKGIPYYFAKDGHFIS